MLDFLSGSFAGGLPSARRRAFTPGGNPLRSAGANLPIAFRPRGLVTPTAACSAHQSPACCSRDRTQASLRFPRSAPATSRSGRTDCSARPFRELGWATARVSRCAGVRPSKNPPPPRSRAKAASPTDQPCCVTAARCLLAVRRLQGFAPTGGPADVRLRFQRHPSALSFPWVCPHRSCYRYRPPCEGLPRARRA